MSSVQPLLGAYGSAKLIAYWMDLDTASRSSSVPDQPHSDTEERNELNHPDAQRCAAAATSNNLAR